MEVAIPLTVSTMHSDCPLYLLCLVLQMLEISPIDLDLQISIQSPLFYSNSQVCIYCPRIIKETKQVRHTKKQQERNCVKKYITFIVIKISCICGKQSRCYYCYHTRLNISILAELSRQAIQFCQQSVVKIERGPSNT